MLQAFDELPKGAQRQYQVAIRPWTGDEVGGLAEVEAARPVIGAVNQEGCKADVIAELVGPQEGIFEQGGADASSLRALIDGEARKEEYRAGLGALTGLQGIWEFAALYCPHR